MRNRPRRPGPLLPNLAPEQRDIEVAVESPLADFLAIVKTLPLHPRRLLLIVFEYRWAIRLHRERNILGKAIQKMTQALESARHGYSVKDIDALDEIWRLIGRDRRRREHVAFCRRLSERNQRLANKRTKILRPAFIEAFHSTSGTDAQIARTMAKMFHARSDSIEKRIRRYREQGVLPRRRVSKRRPQSTR
jgi:hypothetical protein